jgi:hypothetical protein
MNDLIERLRALARCEHSDVSVAEEAADALEAALEDAERWRYIRRKLCLTGNGDGTCAMQAINLPAAIQGWPEPEQVAEFCDAAIDALRERLGEKE